MCVVLEFVLTKRITFLLTLLLSSFQLSAAVDLTAASSSWVTVLVGPNFDVGQDTQATAAVDLTGFGAVPLFYMQYDDGGTPGSANSSDDEIAFRFRADNAVLTSGPNSGAFAGYIWIGIDIDTDADIDAFMMLAGKNGVYTLDVYDSDTGLNTSPSTTSLSGSATPVTTGFSLFHGIVTNIDIAGNPNIDGDSDPDYLISYKVSFDALATALNSKTITGSVPLDLISTINGGSGVDINTSFRVVVASAQNDNTLNGDVGGFDDKNDVLSTTYADQGAISSSLSFAEPDPVDLGTSTIVASPTTVVADGITTSTITVQAKNSASTNLSRSVGPLVLFSTGSAIVSTVTDNNDGTYSATVTNTVVETGTISGSLDGSAITDTADVIFTAVPDTTPPVITLSGITPVTVEKGTAYADEGATALDNIDGNISSSIVTVNPVDSNLVNTYSVTYNVSDVAGNAADQVSRTVNVVDTTSPDVSIINQPVAVNNLTPYTVTFQFSEAVSGFVGTDITVVNGTANVFTLIDSDTYTADITPNGVGNILLSVAANVAQDAALNNNTAATPVVTVFDSIPPAIPTYTIQTTNDTTPVLSGAAEANSTVTVVVGGASYTVIASGTGGWVLDTGTLSPDSGALNLVEGANNVSVTATDAASNSTVNATAGDLTLDTTAPATPTVASITVDSGTSSADGITNDNLPVIAGTWDQLTATTLAVTVNAVVYVLATDTELTSDGSGNWSLDLTALATALPDNTHDVIVSSSDAVGNVAVDATANEFVIDTAITIPTVSSQITNNITPTISGTADTDSAVVIIVAGATYSTTAAAGAWSVDTSSAPPDAGTFTPNVNGSNTVFVTSTDNAGNTANDVTIDELTIDTTPPVVSINTAPAANSSSAGSYTVSGICSVGDGNVSVVITGVPGVLLVDSPTCNGAGIWSSLFDVSGINDGVDAITINATQQDSAFNQGNALTVKADKDITPPAAPTVDSQVTNSVTPVITGTAEADSTVTVGVAGASYTVTANGAGSWSVNTANAPDSGTFLPDTNGVNQVVASSTDSAGNTGGSDTDSDELTIDTTAPAIPTVDSISDDTGSSNVDGITNDTLPVINGTWDEATADSLSVSINLVTYVLTTDAELSSDGSGNWTLDLTALVTPLVDATYDVVVSTADIAGNVSTDASSNEFTIDVTVPTVPVVNLLTTTDPTPVITGSATIVSGDVVTVVVGTASYTVVPDVSNNWTLDTGVAIPDSGVLTLNTGGPTGTSNDVTVTITDTASNTSTDITSAELSIDVDNDDDGIPDAIEGSGDTDTDLATDNLDLDSDNDGTSRCGRKWCQR